MFDIIINPFTTILLVLYELFGQNIFLSIVAFTVLVRLAILPMTLRQQRSMKKMQEVQPLLKELQEKYKDNREQLVQEQMKLYKEYGVNPLASCLPIFIQLPIFIGLWRAIVASLASTPNDLLGLEHRILIEGLDNLVPLKNNFLWMNLALPDQYYILPVLVVITSYIQQKLIVPSTPPRDPKKKKDQPDPSDQAAQMTRQMTTFMPLFFGFLALNYSSGLSIYFITSNIIGIFQYTAMGRANFGQLIGRPAPVQQDAPVGIQSGQMVEATAGADGGSARQLKAGITDTHISHKSSPSRAEKSSSGGSRKKRSGSNSRQKRGRSSASKRNKRR